MQLCMRGCFSYAGYHCGHECAKRGWGLLLKLQGVFPPNSREVLSDFKKYFIHKGNGKKASSVYFLRETFSHLIPQNFITSVQSVCHQLGSGDGSAVRSTHWPCGGPEFSSQCPHQVDSQPPVTLIHGFLGSNGLWHLRASIRSVMNRTEAGTNTPTPTPTHLHTHLKK